MLQAHIHRLVVVDDEDEPAGMLTSFDFVRHVAESRGNEAAAAAYLCNKIQAYGLE